MNTAPRQRRGGALAVICLSVFVISIDTTIVNVAFPTLERSLHATDSQPQWIVDAFTLGEQERDHLRRRRAVGGAVARALAGDGAAVFLGGRMLTPVRAVAEEISAEGGTADAAHVDALDERAIERYVAHVTAKAGRIDILFDAIGLEDIQGTPCSISGVIMSITVEPTPAADLGGFMAACGGSRCSPKSRTPRPSSPQTAPAR